MNDEIKDGSAKDLADSAVLKAMGKLTPAVTVAVAETASVNGGTFSQVSTETTPVSSQKPSVTDGGNGGGKPPSKGGGGGNGGEGEGGNNSFFSRGEVKIAFYVAILFFIVIMYMFLQYFVLNQWSKQLQPVVAPPSDVKKVDERADTVLVPAKSVINSVESRPKKIVEASFSACSNSEQEKENASHALVSQLNAGESLHFSYSGCAWLLQVNDTVTKLDADAYLFVVKTSHTAHEYYTCGNIGSNNDTINSCINFLNKHAGKMVRVAIKEGAHVYIN